RRPRQSRSVWSACVFSPAFPMQTAGSWPVRFMESPLPFFRMLWDHEPRQLVGRGVLAAPRLGGLGTARPTLRFMESKSINVEAIEYGSVHSVRDTVSVVFSAAKPGAPGRCSG